MQTKDMVKNVFHCHYFILSYLLFKQKMTLKDNNHIQLNRTSIKNSPKSYVSTNTNLTHIVLR